MPVSKNKRKNQKNVDQRAQKRAQRLKKENSGLNVLAKALVQFNEIRNNVRKLARMYVDVTQSIPGYQETNPNVMPGLQLAIAALKDVNAQYDALSARVAELAKNPPRSEMEYLPEMSAFEHMNITFTQDFMNNFMPVIEVLEKLGEVKGNDVGLIKETREALAEAKPQFETKVD